MKQRIRDSLSGLVIASAVFSAILPGCRAAIKEDFYVVAPVGDDTNYYRVRLRAGGVLTKIEARQGWFPSTAVDSVLGDVGSAAETSARESETKIRKQVDAALVKANAAYLAEATSDSPDQKKLARLLAARNAVRSSPAPGTGIPAGGEEYVYHPARSLVEPHANEKLVLVLSSDPDAIIQAIARFAEDDKTSESIDMIAETTQAILEKNNSEASVAKEIAMEQDVVVFEAVQKLADDLGRSSGGAPTLNEAADVRGRLEAVRDLLNVVDRGIQ